MLFDSIPHVELLKRQHGQVYILDYRYNCMCVLVILKYYFELMRAPKD